MLSSDNMERAPVARQLTVPVIPGYAQPGAPSEAPKEPLVNTELTSEISAARMWTATGAVVLVSSVGLAHAFAPHSKSPAPPSPCRVTSISEPAENEVTFTLDRAAGSEKVWLGTYDEVLRARPVQGDAATYSLDTFGYFHDTIAVVYIGGVVCHNRFDLGTTQPGIRQFFAE